MLVEDKKEVRLLQEMLLEDGDLHSDGGGRKRIFRWSNNGMYCPHFRIFYSHK